MDIVKLFKESVLSFQKISFFWEGSTFYILPVRSSGDSASLYKLSVMN